MRTIVIAGMFYAASAGLCQTPAKEPDTLQALLTEVHQLRQDIEGMTVASQRVQIALYALQMQDGAVARAMQRFDAARNKCSATEQNRQHTAGEIQKIESGLASGTIPETMTTDFKATLADLKRSLDAQTAEAQACQASESDASTQLRTDQAKLTELQDRIARLDQALEQFGGRK